jgi:hypothetical protein
MSPQRRLLTALGAAMGAAFMSAALASMAAASPADCDAGGCLTLGGDPTDVGYLGFRPFATDWWGNQPVDAVNQAGVVVGSYNVVEQDYLSSIFDASLYHYDDFTPADGSTAGDPVGMSGVSIYDVGFGPGLGGSDGAVDASGQSVLLDSITALSPDGNYYEVVTGPDGFLNTLEISPTDLFGSADFITLPGQDTPTVLWDTLWSASVPDVPDILPPDVLISWP